MHAALYLVVVLAGARRAVHPARARSSSPGCRCSSTSAPSSCCSSSGSCSRARRCSRDESLDNDLALAGPRSSSLFLFGVLTALLVDAFGGKEIKLDDKLVAPGSTEHDRRRDLPRLPRARSRSCRMLLLAALIGAVVLARRD